MSDAPLMLGVSGLRGLVGRSLTPEVAARYGAAVGTWAKQQARRDEAHVVVGRDSRPSGPWVADAVAAGLLAVGCRVTDLGVATTPGVAVMTDHLDADAGVVLTASHNPIVWNGIKALRRGQGGACAPPVDQANAIIDAYKSGSFAYAPPQRVARIDRDATAARVHVDRVLRLVDVEAIRAAGLTAVVDSVHGAGGEEAGLLLEALGVKRVHLYAEPTGAFPHPPEPVKEHLVELAAAVREHRAAVGFAQDPDADRLALVDETGCYIGEEYTLALCALHLLSKGSPRPTTTVANLSTSRMLDDVAARCGATVVRTPVGEAHVAAAMQRSGARVGGEGNGGIIWPAVTLVRDSLAGMTLVLEHLAATGHSLADAVADIPRYAIVKDKIELHGHDVPSLLKTVAHAFDDARADTQDGVRLDWPDRWVHVRPSNTEPIIRLIAEAADEPAARALIARVRDAAGL